MKKIIVLIFVGLLGVAIGTWLAKRRSKKISEAKSMVIEENELKKLNQERAEVKNERKERILNFLQMKGKTSNNEVQQLLSVSDASAENYLDELEKEGKVRQVGETGRGVEYEING
jgi:predicted HTH transcriptional regulator